MNEEKFDDLLYKYLSNKINKEEFEEFLACLEKYDKNYIETTFNYIIDIDDIKSKGSNRKDEIFHEIVSNIPHSRKLNTGITKKIYWYIAGIAATILCIYSFYNYSSFQPKDVNKDFVKHVDILNNEDQIKISFNNTKEGIMLENGQQANLGNLTIEIAKTGEVRYNLNDELAIETGLITIETPRGKTSYIKLIDSSEIWLNAESKITFNPKLNTINREVSLVGEGFFEVKPNKKRPFIVSTNKSKIQVLGTSFNISAFADEALETTTLVEGKVQLNSGNNKVLITPNQQYILNTDSQLGIIKKDIDVSEYIAWKSNNFEFNHKNIQEVLHLLQKWYPIKGITIKKISNDTFTGTFKRSRSLRNVLNQLELVSSYKFEILDDQIIVH